MLSQGCYIAVNYKDGGWKFVGNSGNTPSKFTKDSSNKLKDKLTALINEHGKDNVMLMQTVDMGVKTIIEFPT